MFYAIVLAIIGGLVGLDQLTKWFTVLWLQDGPVTVIPGFFEFTYVENTGAAFGMLEGARWFFVIATGLVMAAMLGVLLFSKLRYSKLLSITLILIISGGIGNLIDRIVNGFVVDMIHVFAAPIGFDFPVFNVADCFVVVGSFLLLAYFFFFYDEKALNKAAEESHGNRSAKG